MRNKFLKFTFYWLLTFSFSIGTIEIFLRIFNPLVLTGGYIGNYVYDKELGVRIKKGYWTYTTDYRQEVYVNDIGTVNFEDNFNEYKNLIFALGDSYTQGTGLPSDSSYPFQLSLSLNTISGSYKKDYAVVNLGLSAYGGEQNLITYRKYKKNLGTPKFILYLGCNNDNNDDQLFLNKIKHKSMVEKSEYFRKKIIAYDKVYPMLQFLIHRTEVGKRLNILRKQIYKNKSYSSNINSKKLSIAELQKRHLEYLVKESKENDIVLIVSWANLDSKKDNSYTWIKEWALKNNVLFADWRKLVISTKEGIPNLPLVNDHSGGHYRSWVNNIIAKSFFEHINN